MGLEPVWKTPPDGSGGSGRSRENTDAQIKGGKKTEEQDDPVVRCRVCQAVVCRIRDQLAVQGRHRHVFANPYGRVFDVACFKQARGCSPAGRPSGEFTWFPGYQWQVGLCRTCLTHLGWRFTGPDSLFFALIVDALIFPS